MAPELVKSLIEYSGIGVAGGTTLYSLGRYIINRLTRLEVRLENTISDVNKVSIKVGKCMTRDDVDNIVDRLRETTKEIFDPKFENMELKLKAEITKCFKNQ